MRFRKTQKVGPKECFKDTERLLKYDKNKDLNNLFGASKNGFQICLLPTTIDKRNVFKRLEILKPKKVLEVCKKSFVKFEY